MAILDKISGFAKNMSSIAGNTVETSKLNSKISSEQSAINALIKQIGEFYYNKYSETKKADKDIAELCAKIDGHNAAIAETKAEIERIKAAPAAGGMVCSSCGKASAPDKKFCVECGGKIIEATPPAASGGTVCPACGRANETGKKFCVGCGGKLEAAAPPAASGGTVCPACGRANEAGKKFCVECGGKLEAAAPPAASGGTVCPACGKSNEADKKFCSECGFKFEQDEKKESRRKK